MLNETVSVSPWTNGHRHTERPTVLLDDIERELSAGTGSFVGSGKCRGDAA